MCQKFFLFLHNSLNCLLIDDLIIWLSIKAQINIIQQLFLANFNIGLKNSTSISAKHERTLTQRRVVIKFYDITSIWIERKLKLLWLWQIYQFLYEDKVLFCYKYCSKTTCKNNFTNFSIACKLKIWQVMLPKIGILLNLFFRQYE